MAISHQRSQVSAHCIKIERLKCFGIVKVCAHRIRRSGVLRKHLEAKLIRPPMLVGGIPFGVLLMCATQSWAFVRGSVHRRSPICYDFELF